MGTVGKALSLLNIFTVAQPEFGLTEIARRCGFDKATARRLLLSLSQHGFIEQDPESRLYRLGAGLTRLARIREARFPLLQTALPHIHKLALETSETVHLSEAGSGGLLSVYVEHPSRANRVNVNVGEYWPLHCTASGMAFLADAPSHVVEQVASGGFESFTPFTVSDRKQLIAVIEQTRARGFALNDQGYEEGVISVAAAILGHDGYAVGALSVAAPMARMSKKQGAEQGKQVSAVANQITKQLNGEKVVPARLTASK